MTKDEYLIQQLSIVLSSRSKEQVKEELKELKLVEPGGIEPPTSCVRNRRSPD